MKTLSHITQENQVNIDCQLQKVDKPNVRSVISAKKLEVIANYSFYPGMTKKKKIQVIKRIFNENYLPPTMSLSIRELMFEYIKNKRRYLYQARLASLVDKTRTHLNQCLQLLQRMGLLRIHNRGYNSCMYFLDPIWFHPKTIKFLKDHDHFKFLKITMLAMLLFFSPLGIGSINRTPCLNNRWRSLVDSIYTIERYDLGQSASFFFNIKTRRELIASIISPLNHKISANLGWTEYTSLQCSFAPDNFIEIAYNFYLKHKKNVRNSALFILKTLRTICKNHGFKPKYSDIDIKCHVAGYRYGDRLLLSDPESQPRFEKDTKDNNEVLKKEDLRPRTGSFLDFLGPEITKNIMRNINT